MKMKPFARPILMLHGYIGSGKGIGAIAMLFWCALIAACSTAVPGFSSAEVASLDRLLLWMRSRLELTPEVAKNKWNTKSAIEDTAREKVIVDSLATQASRYGLACPATIRFFQAQIEGSKAIQAALFAEWDANGQKKFSRVPDLAKDIRPVLDKMTPEMLALLSEVMPVLSRPGADRLVVRRAGTVVSDVPGFEKGWRIALEPIAEFSSRRRD